MNKVCLMETVEQLHKSGKLEQATYHCAIDIMALFDQARTTAWKELQHIKTAHALMQWRRSEVLYRQETIDQHKLAERYDIGHGMAYGCIEMMLSCIDHEFILNLLIQLRKNND